MTTKLIESLRTKKIVDFKYEVEAILQDKVLAKIEEMRQEIKESKSTEEIRDFFQFIGAESYFEDELHIGAVFPNKAALNTALTQIHQFAPDLDYEIYYYQDMAEEPNPDIPWYPHDEDDEEHEVVSVDWEEIPYLDAGDKFEIVVYKEDDEGYTHDDVDDHDVYEAMEKALKPKKDADDENDEAFKATQKKPAVDTKKDTTIKEQFSNQQLAQLKKEYSKVKTVDPNSESFIKLKKFVEGLPPAAKKQIRDERIPFLWILAKEGFWDTKYYTYKDAQKQFASGKNGRPDPIWAPHEGKGYWLEPQTGELLQAKETAKPAGAKEYSGNPNKPIKEGWEAIAKLSDAMLSGKHGKDLKAAINSRDKKKVAEVAGRYKGDNGFDMKYLPDAIKSLQSYRGIPESLEEAKNDSIRRMWNKMLSWGNTSPQEMMKRIASYSDEELIGLYRLADVDKAGDGSERQTQLKLISRELKKRNGLTPSGKLKEEFIFEANQNEGGRLIKRRVSFSKKKRGGKLVNRRQRRKKGKVSKGAGKGYKAKGAGWKTKLIHANRKRKISKRKNVKAQKMGKRFAKRSRNLRKSLGFKAGT